LFALQLLSLHCNCYRT